MDINIKKEKNRSRLLNSAYWLFTNKGFQSTTISAIAKRAGLGKGTFYLYFDDKEDIRDTLIMIKSSKLLRLAIDEISENGRGTTFTDRLIEICDYIIDFLKDDKELLKFISKSLSWGLFTKAANYGEKSEDIIDFESFVDSLIEKSNVELKDRTLFIFTVIELMNSTCYSTIINSEPTTIDEYKPYLFNAIRTLAESSIK